MMGNDEGGGGADADAAPQAEMREQPRQQRDDDEGDKNKDVEKGVIKKDDDDMDDNKSSSSDGESSSSDDDNRKTDDDDAKENAKEDAESEHKGKDVAATKPPRPPNKYVAFFKSPRFEATGRGTLTCFLAYTLSVSYVPLAIPPGFAGFIGIMTPVISTLAPRMAFTMGLFGPLMTVSFIFAIAVGSMYLCAATVSSGLMAAVYGVTVLWFTGLRHGEDEGLTAGMLGLITVIAGMVSLSLSPLVQDGINVTWTAGSEQDIGNEMKAVLSAMCEQMGQSSECYTDSGVPDFFEETIAVGPLPPSAGNLADQTAYLTYDPIAPYALNVYIPGGLWIVAGLWKFRGLENPLAFFRNFMIALCWCFLCVGVGVLLPPTRTVRTMLSEGMVPKVLSGAAAVTRMNTTRTPPPPSPPPREDDNGESKPHNEEEDADADADAAVHEANTAVKEAKSLAIQTTMIGAANTIGDGSMAAMIAYEPRLCKQPFELLWPKLKELLKATNAVNLTALSTYEQSVREYVTLTDAGEAALERLDKCSEALATNSGDVSELGRHGADKDDEEQDDEPDMLDVETADADSFRVIYQKSFLVKARRVEAATIDWLTSYHHPKAAGCKGCFMAYAPFVMPFVKIFKRLLVTLTLPFKPSRWNWKTVGTDVKFTAGLVALFCMEVFWDSYRQFTLKGDATAGGGGDNTAASVTINGEPAPQNFSGWALVAYLFANTPTTEGTVKKALLRLIGTCLGGFSAWLGIIVCSGSYEPQRPVNPYGLVAWLTATHAVASYYSLDAGGSGAMMGMSKDYGHWAFYFILTQAVCATSIYGGSDRDNIVANRITANCVGIGAAVVLAILPPQVRGGDLDLLRAMVKVQKESLADGLRWLLLGGRASNDTAEKASGLVKDAAQIRDTFETSFRASRKHADFRIKDAMRLHQLPYFKVDPRVAQEHHGQSVTGAFVFRMLDHVRFLLEAAASTSEDGPKGERMRRGLLANEELRGEIEAALRRLEGVVGRGKKEGGSGKKALGEEEGGEDNGKQRDDQGRGGASSSKECYEQSASSNAEEASRDSMQLLVAMINNIVERIEGHEAVLGEMEEVTWPGW